MKLKEFELKKVQLLENSERLSNLFRSLVNQHGFESTLKYTGFDPISLAEKLGPYKNYTAYDYYNLIYELFKKNEIETSIGNYELYFDSDGILNWDYKSINVDMYSLCTPFWDDDFRIPIDVNHYRIGSELFEINEYDSIKITQRPETVEEIISWFNNFYIHSVRHKLDEFLIELRRRY